MSRHRSGSKRPPPDIGLHMECEEEELDPSQVAYYSRAEREYNEIQCKLDNYLKKMKAEVIEKGDQCVVLQLNAGTSGVVSPSPAPATSAGGKPARQSVQSSANYQQLPSPGIITRSNANPQTNAYLVMDPRLGFVVGQMPSSGAPAEQVTTTTPSKPVTGGRTRQQAATTGSVMVTTRAKSGLKKQGSATGESENLTPTVIRTRQQEKAKSQAQQQVSSPQTSPQQQQVFAAGSTPSGPGNFKIKVNAKQGSVQPAKPNESNAVGGLSAGGKAFKGNEKSDSADSREVTFSRLTGKIFPSLVVVARPHLKLKYIPQATIQQERSALDSRVKGVLMYSPSKFVEWLIQQGLIRSEQNCLTHISNDFSPVKLKLGMYSDVSKFPYSGGYVWISDCCPQQFVSVFSGSIFEGAPHPPTTLLKLIYHWACQTNVQNVVQWVKVDNLYLKNFYTNMRAVCTQAIHEKFKKLGGPRKKIEVGVISLGTTSQDGNKRQVKVEVLGIMDQENKSIRLRAVEPLSEERSFKRRFVKILEPLEEWVHKESVILTDFTVAKAALNTMGFNSVYQVTNDSKLSNQNVMEYLRRIVPRMFQNTLSLLSRQIIQQFLDELVWREMWAPIPSQAFVTIISHLAEQTKLDVTENFLVRLNKVAANPFKVWNYSAWKPTVPGTSKTGSKTLQKSSSSSQESIPGVTIETSETQTPGKGTRTRKRAAEQALSETVTPPASVKKVAKISIKEKQKKEDKAFRKESSDSLSEEVIAFINEGNEISLENYYYCSRKSDEEVSHRRTGTFNVKCCVCNKRFSQNIVLMKHMILHCQTEPVLMIDLKRVHQCEHCFLGFNTGTALKVHLQEVHSFVDGKIESNLICHICEQKFGSRVDLIYHMHTTHVQLEMPYECGVCRFRTSVYRVFVDHFIQVHSLEDHVFCPYCLKVVTLSFKGEAITSNVFFYMAHLEKHQRPALLKDCNRCQLSFIHKGILDQHTEADHGTWKHDGSVTPIDHLPTGIFMPEPSGVIKGSPVPKPLKHPKAKSMFAMNKFKSLEIYGLDEDMACVECEGSLTFSEHFTGSFNCLRCRYASCCEKAMIEHSAIFHETAQPHFTLGKPIILPQEMFCACGYSSSSGNRIAKHLALCERESAYPSKEAVAALVQVKEASEVEEKVKEGDGQNVLNMLGLIRKSPEATSSGGSDWMKLDVEEREEGEEEEEEEEEEAEAEGKKEKEERGEGGEGKKEKEKEDEVEEVEGDRNEEDEREGEGGEEGTEVKGKVAGEVEEPGRGEEDEAKDFKLEQGMEVAETRSQDESDTSESQQDNSVINALELRESKEKSRSEGSEAVSPSDSSREKETRVERPLEEPMEVCEDNTKTFAEPVQEEMKREETTGVVEELPEKQLQQEVEPHTGKRGDSRQQEEEVQGNERIDVEHPKEGRWESENEDLTSERQEIKSKEEKENQKQEIEELVLKDIPESSRTMLENHESVNSVGVEGGAENECKNDGSTGADFSQEKTVVTASGGQNTADSCL